MVCSMRRRGICWDNAPVEGFFNSLKNECVFGRRYATRTAAHATCLNTLKRFTAAVAVIPRSATIRQPS